MADKKISELTELTAPDGAEELVVNDSGTSKKITIDNLITGIDDNATSTAITLNSSGSVNFNGLIGQMTGAYCYLRFRDDGIADTITIDSRKKVASGKGNIRFTTTDSVGSTSERLKITGDGRGLSQFTAKAWVNFDGTGTVAIADSHNVSSITDVATGKFTIVMTNALGNTSYAPVGSSSGLPAVLDNMNVTMADEGNRTTTQFKAYTRRSDNNTYGDTASVTIIVFGD